ncbi:hypothetical protein DV736_g2395, partial [Chaetothyriales sp. CBS 134916]
MAQLKVLIVGAGIAGNAAAFWLSKLGHAVTVLERHPCLRINGLQLDLRGDGIKAIRIMGLEEAIRSKLVPEEGVEIVDSAGHRKAYFPANKTGKGAQSMTSEFEIMRQDLCRLLHDKAVEHGTTYIFGSSVESFEENGREVDVKFTDGRTDRFDLVIGADGQGSRIRRLLFGGIAEGTKDSSLRSLPGDQRTAYFTAPRPIEEGEEYIATAYLMPGKRFILTRRHSPNEIQWYLRCPASTDRLKNAQKGDVKAEKEAFAEAFQDSGWRTDEVVKALKEGADDFYCEHGGFVKLDNWSRGRVALLGDAAWCPTSNGYGTSAAIVGAYILAGEIATHYGRGDGTGTDNNKVDNAKDIGSSSNEDDALLSSLSAFETKLRPFIKQIQKGLSSDPNIFDKLPSTWLTVAVFNFIAGVTAFLGLDIIASRLSEKDNIKGWELPGYKDMVQG